MRSYNVPRCFLWFILLTYNNMKQQDYILLIMNCKNMVRMHYTKNQLG